MTDSYSPEVEQRVHTALYGYVIPNYYASYNESGANMMLAQLRDKWRETERYVRAAAEVGTEGDKRRAAEEVEKALAEVTSLQKQIFKSSLGSRDSRMDRRLERQRRALRTKHFIHIGCVLAFFIVTPLAIAIISYCWKFGINSVAG